MQKFLSLRISAGLLALVSMLVASAAQAQTGDYFILLSGERRSVTITRADNQSVFYQASAGEVPQPWRTLKTYGLAERPAVKAALAAVEAGNYAQAVPVLKQTTDAFVGSPVLQVPWVAEAAVALVRCYTELKQFNEAEAVAKRLPPAEATRVKSYQAIALAGQGKHDEAIALLSDVVKIGDAKLAVTPAEGRMLGQAFLALGDCYASKNQLNKALESYLTTVVLYFHDETALRLAQTKAEEIKKKLNPTEQKTQGS